MKEDRFKNEKFKNGIYILLLLCLGRFLMSDFAYDNIFRYNFVNIGIDILMLVILGVVLKKVYNKNINKYVTIATFSAILVFFLYIFALSTGIYYSPAVKVIKEMKILGAIVSVTSFIYIIQYIKRSIKE